MNKKPRAECQVCEREQALDNSGRMVNHGYKRPGYGFIVGNCFGVGYEPYPKTDALELWLESLEDITKRTAEKLETIGKNEHDTIPMTFYENYKHVTKWLTVSQLVELTQKDRRYSLYNWKGQTEKYAAELERELRQLGLEKSRVRERIKNARKE